MRNGITLLEVLIVLAVVSIMLAVSLPAFNNLLTRTALNTVSREFHVVLNHCRQMAISRNRYVGVKFLVERGELYFGIFMDGNHNGIRSREIQSGVDPMVRPYTPLQLSRGRVVPGILSAEIPDMLSGSPIHNPDDPVKFGAGDICSFSPLGQGSPGTIYVTDGRELQAAVRVYPRSAMTRIMVYDPVRGWHRLFE